MALLKQVEIKRKKGGFWGTLVATLGSSLLGNMLARKEVKRAGEGTIRAVKGLLRTGEGTIRARKSTNRAG